MTKPIVIDLFCGAGGMSEGLIQAGFHIAFSSDMNEQVQQTYMHRHEQLGLVQGVNTHFERSDIRELSGALIKQKIGELKPYREKPLPEIDAIFGGPPCQGFSRAGKRQKNDPRNMLFKEYLRVIDEIKPNYVVMENVEGMLDTRLDGFVGVKGHEYPDHTLVPDLLHKEFDRIGYDHLEPRLLDASNYGVPQRRKRVIYIAYKKGLPAPNYPEPTTPLPEQKVTVGQAISDLILDKTLRTKHAATSSYQLDSQRGRTVTSSGKTQVKNHEPTKHDTVIQERFSLYRDGESQKHLMNRLNEGFDLTNYPVLLEYCAAKLAGAFSKEEIIQACRDGAIHPTILEAILTKKNSRLRLHREEVGPTMLSSSDDFISPFENRGLTVREMARIQSFDDSFEFLGKRTTGGLRRRVEVPQLTQVGNAVPPLLAKAIALEIRKVIKK